MKYKYCALYCDKCRKITMWRKECPMGVWYCMNCYVLNMRGNCKARPNEIGGRGNGKSIRYGLCMALQIIDKYKAESEVEE